MRAMRAALEVIHQMNDDMGSPGLARELEIIARQHVTVQAKAKFHFGHTTMPQRKPTRVPIQFFPSDRR